jgi:hypothetical protein
MRKLALTTGLLVLLGFGGNAQALSIDVQYNVSSSLAVLNGLLPVGSLSGPITVRYSGNAAGTAIVPGKARILTWQGNGPISVVSPLLGGASVTGTQSLAGGLQSQGGFTFGGNLLLPLAGAGAATIQCNITVGGLPGACLAAPLSLPTGVPLPGPASVSTVLLGLATAPITTGAGDMLGTFSMSGFFGSFGGFPISGTSTFTEVSRTATPEPSSLSMLWLGVAGLAGARSWSRRRARA